MAKVDNADLHAKLELRRYFLRKYHADGSARVMDCCQGNGVLWSILRREFDVANYWGVDLKPKPGRLKLDSARILDQPGWRDDVIDVDTYGAPWAHWAAIIKHLDHPATVFLTVGQWQMGTHHEILEALRIPPKWVPPGIAVKLQGFSLSYLLTKVCENPIIQTEAREACSTGSARYFGIRFE